MSELEIVSDGTARGTTVRLKDGCTLKGVTAIEIEPISPGGTVRAKITIDCVALQMKLKHADINCTDNLTAARIMDVLEAWNPAAPASGA